LFVYSGRALLYGMLAVVFGVGMVVISWRMMRSGEGRYDAASSGQGALFNILGLLIGLALAVWGAWVLCKLVPEYIFW
jgi:hypothetical protein